MSDLPEWNGSMLSFFSETSTIADLERIESFAHHRASLFRHTLAVANKLRRSNAKRTVYLFDFDVICSYFQGPEHAQGWRVSGYFAVRTLAFLRECEFAIPEGAFRELVSYISFPSRIVAATSALKRTDSSHRASATYAAANALCTALRIQGSPTTRHEVLLARLSAFSTNLRRLSELLDAPGFRGIVTGYDERHKEDIKASLSAVERPPWSDDTRPNRKSRDECDAINLAIASDHVCVGGHQWTSSILVTQTAALFQQRYRPKVTGKHEPIVCSARSALAFDILGGSRNLQAAHSRLRSYHRTVEELASAVREEIGAKDESSDSLETSNHRQLVIKNLLELYTYDVCWSNSESWRELEEHLEQVDITAPRQELRPPAESTLGDGPVNRYSESTEALRRIVDRLHKKLHAALDPKERGFWVKHEAAGDAQSIRYTLCERMGSLQRELVVAEPLDDDGAIFLAWPTSCSELVFWASVAATARVLDARDKGRQTRPGQKGPRLVLRTLTAVRELPSSTLNARDWAEQLSIASLERQINSSITELSYQSPLLTVTLALGLLDEEATARRIEIVVNGAELQTAAPSLFHATSTNFVSDRESLSAFELLQKEIHGE